MVGFKTAHPDRYDILKENARCNRKKLTPAEALLWQQLRGDKLGVSFRRQHPISDYIADFYCYKARLVIELDGKYHDDPLQQYEDKVRTENIKQLGCTILRFTNQEVFEQLEIVINSIKQNIKNIMEKNSSCNKQNCSSLSGTGRAGGGALTQTNYNFPGQTGKYCGKTRDCYFVGDDLMVMVASDRISAFDVILPKGIPFKGQVLNQIAAKFLDATTDICPNWKLACPDPQVTIGVKCEGFKVEMIIRGILTGSAWRDYKNGCREICGVKLPDGMRENERFPEPIITPTTKADEGHDLNISKEEIIAQGIVSKEDYEVMEDYTRKLFARGQEIAAKQGLILVDTKYEFGKHDGKVYLIDEVHTPDSSRYFYAEGYEEKFEKGEPQRQLSKEFVRQWLIDRNFMNREGDVMPEITDEYANSVAERYIELYEGIVGEKFQPAQTEGDIAERIEKSVTEWLANR